MLDKNVFKVTMVGKMFFLIVAMSTAVMAVDVAPTSQVDNSLAFLAKVALALASLLSLITMLFMSTLINHLLNHGKDKDAIIEATKKEISECRISCKASDGGKSVEEMLKEIHATIVDDKAKT